MGSAPLTFAVPGTTANSDFFSVTPEKLPAHSNAELNRIFISGIGTYTSAMNGKIYPYLMPQNATGNVPYNGCYDEKSNRIGSLDADNSCAAWIKARPGVSIFRLFIGYKVDCSEVSPTGGCLDMALLMNCQYTQVAVGIGPFDTLSSPRLCSKGNPIVRKAKANLNNTPAFNGCYPGQDGTTYPDCTACANGTFNAIIGENKSSCTSCTMDPIPNASTQPTLFVTDPTSGALSASQCRIDPLDSWTCSPGYTKTSDNQACVKIPNCSLALSVAPTNPSAVGAADGKIIASYSGQSGTVSAFSILSPTAITPNPLVGTSGTFAGLTQNTYKVSVTDSSCTTSTNVTLTDSTPMTCTTCPTGSTPSGNQCMIAPTSGSTYSTWTYTCQGYGGCTTAPCQAVTCMAGQPFGQVSMADTTPRTCDGAYFWASFGGDCYKNNTVSPNPFTTTTLSCPGGYTLTAGTCTTSCKVTPSTCTLTLNATGTNPTTSTGTNGSITASTTGSIGTVSFTSSSGTVTQSGANALVTGLGGGTYIITAADSAVSGCSSSKSVALTSP